jgi:hypothetical protein
LILKPSALRFVLGEDAVDGGDRGVLALVLAGRDDELAGDFGDGDAARPQGVPVAIAENPTNL